MSRSVLGILLVMALTAVIYIWRKNKKICRTIDRMLDEVLNRNMITYSDIKEGELSLLASKIMRIQEKMEQDITQAQEEKEQVKSLISNMSHQLKTPLANVMMYQEILEDKGLDPNLQESFLLKMKIQLEKIDWILRSLFKMVKLEQGAIVFDVIPSSLQRTLLQAVNTVYEKAEEKHIEIITEPFEDCSLYLNCKWTAEVFANILENGIKYTEAKGRIHIRVSRMELFTEVQFEDNGIGIQESELPDVFKRFYRSKDVEQKEGSGIGLYLSRLILEKEKGYMTVRSEYGKGSCFSVFLQNCQNEGESLSRE